MARDALRGLVGGRRCKIAEMADGDGTLWAKTILRRMGLSSGNLAFNEWRRAEIVRLSEQHKRIEATRRRFTEFMNTLRRAKDREEFDRFWDEFTAPTQDDASTNARAPNNSPAAT